MAGFDAVFLALHGGAGEDGTLQRYLERRGIAFTGPDSAAAKAAMSKSASKARFRAGGVPTPACRRFDRRTQLGELSRAAAELGYPLVVKPDSQGSSLGVSLVSTADDLPAAAHQALQCDTAGLLEAFIPGREFTLALVDRQPLPLVEVCCRRRSSPTPRSMTSRRFTTASRPACPRKSSSRSSPPRWPPPRPWRPTAWCASTSLDRRNRPWVLELNATPGMTETSLAPAAARQAGLDLGQLCDSLLQSCLQRRITV